MDKKMVHWDVEVDEKYSPVVLCTEKGWRFDAGIKIKVSDMEFFARPGLNANSPLLGEWSITDGISGAKAFVSPPMPVEEIDHTLNNMVTQFAIFLATTSEGNLDAIKSKAKKFLVECEKKHGKKPEKAPEEFIKRIELANATALQTGEIVH